ncbi:hypothetical protein [Ralstonia sp. ASV6]|uniref:hypothetical protein n=1 Tax=Ralstonia sp. ASV6 TaxID=2795124 RepID=UPI0018EC9A19|nr:hypothetical protein [Ralstonia sp. ASV6]
MTQLTIDQFHENLGMAAASRTVKNAVILGHAERGTTNYQITFADDVKLDVKPIRGLDGEPALSVEVSKGDAHPLPVSNFERVAQMNVAFDNPQGDPRGIDWSRVRSQCKNIGHEFAELLVALGADKEEVDAIVQQIDALQFNSDVNLKQVRDSLCDVHVFGYGAHHLMGIDADRDMGSVIEGVMTRFVKNDADRAATIAKHASAGVTDVYFVGEYPTMVMKSASDQPDAPKGKFLKSASYTEPEFYEP